MTISRMVEMDQASELASLVTQVLTIPTPNHFQPDAIAGHAGMGEPWRIKLPIEEWETNKSARFFLLAGMYWEERCYEPLTVEYLIKHYGLRRTEGVRVQLKARHTKAQTDWLIEQTNDLEIGSLVFLSSPYHLARAYLTLLKSWMQFGRHVIVMLPKILSIPPTIILPEVGEPARVMIPGEIRRIIEYQAKGDVATLEELEQYLDNIIYPHLKLSP